MVLVAGVYESGVMCVPDVPSSIVGLLSFGRKGWPSPTASPTATSASCNKGLAVVSLPVSTITCCLRGTRPRLRRSRVNWQWTPLCRQREHGKARSHRTRRKWHSSQAMRFRRRRLLPSGASVLESGQGWRCCFESDRMSGSTTGSIACH